MLERHYDRLFAVCRRLLGNDENASDATQEALISIVRALGRFDGRNSFSTWAYRVATNAALDELRRRGRRPAPVDPTLHDGELAGSSSGDGAGDFRDAIGARLDLDAALGALPEDQRAVVVLRDLVDLDYREIAAALEIPIGTVRSRIARGRAALADLLDPGRTSAASPSTPATVAARATGARPIAGARPTAQRRPAVGNSPTAADRPTERDP